MADVVRADAVIVGSGQAAPALAVALAQRGESVVLVEARQLGGTCVNTGCTPTKTLRKSARVAHMARRAAEFGVHVGEVRVDFAAAMQRMQQRVEASRTGLEKWLAGQANVQVERGFGSFAGRTDDGFELQAGTRRIRATRVYLNTGTRPFVPPIPGLDAVPHLDNAALLQLRELPRHLVILGGSYIGLEFAQIFRRLGSQVSVVEGSPRIASREDPEVSDCIRTFLEEEGIRIVTGQAVRRAEREGDGVALVAGGERIAGSHLLVATGRVPNTDRLALDTVGLQTDGRGFIRTNGRLETPVAGIWALGDINGRGAFTHTSYHDHEIVLANHLGGDRSADTRTMAYAMYTDPPLGRVGLSESEARASGQAHLLATYAMADVSRAREESETTGLVKILVEAASGRIAGATIVGINADEIIQCIGNFMATGSHYRVLQQALPVHPTVTEFLPTILGRLKPLA